MRLEQLVYFEAALQHGSLRRAAVALDVSQPTLSAQIQRLEEDLGVVLLTRGSHGVRPTHAGETLLPHVRGTLRSAQAIRAEADAVNGLQSGRVSIGTIPAASNDLLPGVVASFQQEYPNVQFQVTECGSRFVREGVLSGDFDLGIASRFDEDSTEPELRYIDLRSGRLVLTLPEDHELAELATIGVGDLAGQPVVVMEAGTLLHDAYERLAEQVSVRPVYRINTTASAERLVRAGVGLSLANTLAPTTRSRPGVVLAPLDASWAAIHVSLVLRAGERPSPAAREFLTMLRGPGTDAA